MKKPGLGCGSQEPQCWGRFAYPNLPRPSKRVLGTLCIPQPTGTEDEKRGVGDAPLTPTYRGREKGCWGRFAYPNLTRTRLRMLGTLRLPQPTKVEISQAQVAVKPRRHRQYSLGSGCCLQAAGVQKRTRITSQRQPGRSSSSRDRRGSTG